MPPRPKQQVVYGVVVPAKLLVQLRGRLGYHTRMTKLALTDTVRAEHQRTVNVLSSALELFEPGNENGTTQQNRTDPTT